MVELISHRNIDDVAILSAVHQRIVAIILVKDLLASHMFEWILSACLGSVIEAILATDARCSRRVSKLILPSERASKPILNIGEANTQIRLRMLIRLQLRVSTLQDILDILILGPNLEERPHGRMSHDLQVFEDLIIQHHL